MRQRVRVLSLRFQSVGSTRGASLLHNLTQELGWFKDSLCVGYSHPELVQRNEVFSHETQIKTLGKFCLSPICVQGTPWGSCIDNGLPPIVRPQFNDMHSRPQEVLKIHRSPLEACQNSNTTRFDHPPTPHLQEIMSVVVDQNFRSTRSRLRREHASRRTFQIIHVAPAAFVFGATRAGRCICQLSSSIRSLEKL